MAEALKYVYNKAFIDELISVLDHLVDNFDKEVFLSNFFTPSWDLLELKERMSHISITT